VSVEGEIAKVEVKVGHMVVIPLGRGEFKDVTVTPAKGFDVGAGKGKAVTKRLEGGTVGIMIDARGRPFVLPTDKAVRIKKLREWLQAMGLPLPS
jgi:hypothetical protein